MGDNELKQYGYENFIGKLINYYVEIEEYKKYLNVQQEKIEDIVERFVEENMEGKPYETKYSIAKLIDKEIKLDKGMRMQYIKSLNEAELQVAISFNEGKSLMNSLAKNSEIVESYREYILNINKKLNKDKIIKYLIENKKIVLLKVDVYMLEEILKYPGNYSSYQVKLVEFILNSIKKEFGNSRAIEIAKR